MRISDWSSDVCSSDLTCVACHGANGKVALPGIPDFTSAQGPLARKTDAQLTESILNGLQTPGAAMAMPAQGGNPAVTESAAAALARYLHAQFYGGRSAERRVGKGGVRTCRSRGWPYH